MPVLNDQERRDRDIYHFVLSRLNQKVGDQQKFRFQAILEMARDRFYLAPETIAKIFREYEDTTPDQAQLNMFDLGTQLTPPPPTP